MSPRISNKKFKGGDFTTSCGRTDRINEPFVEPDVISLSKLNIALP